MIVCAVDFHALASSCRGKKRLGEPEAALVESLGKGAAYKCSLCKQFHNGKPTANRADFKTLVRDTVRALGADPRVGWQGLLNLDDAWHPNVSERATWYLDLDQKAAYAYSET